MSRRVERFEDLIACAARAPNFIASSISKPSCAELRTYIHLARRLGYLDDDTAAASLIRAEEVSRIIGGLRTTVAKHRAKAASD